MNFARQLSLAAAVGCCLNAATLEAGLAAPDDTLGMALLSAVVNGDGTLARGSGVVSQAHLFIGGYEVVFDRDVTQCSYTATVGPAGPTAAIGVATVAPRDFQPNGVFVETFNSTFALADEPFHLLVFCPR